MKKIKLLKEIYGLRKKDFTTREVLLIRIGKKDYIVQLGYFSKTYKVNTKGKNYFPKFTATTIEEIKDTLIETLKYLGFKEKHTFYTDTYTSPRLCLDESIKVVKKKPLQETKKKIVNTKLEYKDYFLGLGGIIILLLIIL